MRTDAYAYELNIMQDPEQLPQVFFFEDISWK